MIRVEGIYEAEEFDYEGAIAELKKEMRAVAQSMKSNFELATRNWEHKPDFPIQGPRIVAGDMMVAVLPRGPHAKIFEYVDKGTEEHPIVPRAPGYPLRFRRGYDAKSTPGTLWPNMGAVGKFGAYRSKYLVQHPGIEPREFSRRIAINHLDDWQRRMARVMLKFARRSQRGAKT